MTAGAGWLAARIDGSRAEDVRNGLVSLIATGELRAGTRLPTIRRLAQELDTNQTAVATAWGMLRREGLVETHRRGGTLVLPVRRQEPRRAEDAPSRLDLVDARAESDFVPDLRDALMRALQPPRVAAKVRTISAELLAVAGAQHPFGAERFTVMPGGLASLASILTSASAEFGDVIALESPTLMRSIAVAGRKGRHVVPVECDAAGPLPASVAAALSAGARILVFQPQWSVPLGATLTAERAAELAGILADRADVLVVEEDSVGPLVRGASLGATLPGQVVRITQYGRAYGPDLDIAVVGGAARVVDPVREAQRASGLKVSPLLQDALAQLLVDSAASALVGHAAERYAARHASLARSLRAFGLDDRSVGGLFALLPVDDEEHAVAALSAAGVIVAPARRGAVAPQAPAIRIATTGLPDDTHAMADLVAIVASALREEVTVDGD